MNPIVIAALISLAGVVVTAVAVVVTAVAGFRAGRRNLEQTVAAERERQLWDHRAAIYVDTLAAVEHRIDLTNEALHDPGSFRRWQPEAVTEWLAQLELPEKSVLQARLTAFGSEPFRHAYGRWLEKLADVLEAARRWRDHGPRASPAGIGLPDPNIRNVIQALEELQARTVALQQLGNQELQARAATSVMVAPSGAWRSRLRGAWRSLRGR